MIEDKSLQLDQTFNALQMPGETLTEVEFDNCRFEHCDLSDAVLNRCRFIDCVFEHCNLSNISLSFSRLSDVQFSHCKMTGIDWTRLNWPQTVFAAPMRFEHCRLHDTSFFGLQLDELEMRHCDAHHANFTETSLENADLRHCDFSEAVFHATNLKQADLTDAVNYAIDFRDCRIEGAIFSRMEATRLLDCLNIQLVDD
ncbi:Pentapeptide repeat protein [BD1-7 clade bacterium]|uniref:Pentapeptide repeat protein n=1 Tax=BD1-7 clade bacterium TaxID=2029982 RepID=A0A5S9QYM1_9GAMM|nr:Pentapeptide repeat protein [BD1-7 clade bacterium]